MEDDITSKILDAAYEAGYSDGWDEGYDEGLDGGYDEGRIEGHELIAQLEDRLATEKEASDIISRSKDDFKERLKASQDYAKGWVEAEHRAQVRIKQLKVKLDACAETLAEEDLRNGPLLIENERLERMVESLNAEVEMLRDRTCDTCRNNYAGCEIYDESGYEGDAPFYCARYWAEETA